MRSYLKHSSTERARLRHAAFAQARNRQIAFEILQKQAGIAGIKQGPESFLLFLEPEADLEQICAALEEKLPVISREENPVPAPRQMAKQRNPYRKEILKIYLSIGISTVALGALGFYHWHKAFAWIFSAFAVEHVWTRRKAL